MEINSILDTGVQNLMDKGLSEKDALSFLINFTYTITLAHHGEYLDL